MLYNAADTMPTRWPRRCDDDAVGAADYDVESCASPPPPTSQASAIPAHDRYRRLAITWDVAGGVIGYVCLRRGSASFDGIAVGLASILLNADRGK